MEVTGEIGAIKGLIMKAVDQVKARDEEIAGLRKDLVEAQNQLSGERAKVKELEEELNSVIAQVAQGEEDNIANAASVASVSTPVQPPSTSDLCSGTIDVKVHNELKDKHDNLIKIIREITGAEPVNTSREQLKKQLEEANAKIAELTKSVVEITEDRDELMARLTELADIEADHKDRLTSLEANNGDLCAENNKVVNDLRTAENAVTEKDTIITDLRARLQEALDKANSNIELSKDNVQDIFNDVVAKLVKKGVKKVVNKLSKE